MRKSPFRIDELQNPGAGSGAILSPAIRWESSQIRMPRQRQNENSILKKIAGSSWSSRGQGVWHSVALGVGDDAALFRPKPGREIILTCDWFLEGTHFLREKHPPDAVGWKCLARAVSDVAAMGGAPRCFLLSLALPETHTGKWLDMFLGGLRRASRKFQCPLAGGDTTRRNEILINVTVVGEVRAGSAVLRSGARADDILYVSGRLGEAELGLRIMRQRKGAASKKNPLTRKHLYPEPRLALGQWLVKKGLATAMMDLSDGLSSDLPRLCAASGVGARIEETKLPVVKLPLRFARGGVDPLKLALDGGDDYELLFTVPKGKARLVPGFLEGVRLTKIGEVTRKKKIILGQVGGLTRELMPLGWDPFRR